MNIEGAYHSVISVCPFKRLEICEGELHDARCEIDALKVTLEVI